MRLASLANLACAAHDAAFCTGGLGQFWARGFSATSAEGARRGDGDCTAWVEEPGARSCVQRFHVWRIPDETPQDAKEPGDDLFCRGAAPSVFSALESLTSVFGMGTGMASPLQSPGSAWRSPNP